MKIFLVILLFGVFGVPSDLYARGKRGKKPRSDYPQIAKAVKGTPTGGVIAILFRGDGWDHKGEVFSKNVWSQARIQNATSFVPVEVAIPDFSGPTLRNTPYSLWKLPLLLLTDSNGRPLTVAHYDAKMDMDAVFKWVEMGRRVMRRRDECWSTTATGVQRAEALGKGFDSLADVIDDANVRKIYDKEFRLLEKSDPDDKTGYLCKYSTLRNHVYGSFKSIGRVKTRDNLDKALAEFDRLLSYKMLKVNQYQKIYAARFTFLKHAHGRKIIPDKEFRTRATEDLKKLIKLDPESMTARAATVFLKETTNPSHHLKTP